MQAEELAKVGSLGRLDDVLAREKKHYDEHKRYIIHFLTRDRNVFERWILRNTLMTWDRQVAHLDPAWFIGKTAVEVGCGNPRFLFLMKRWGAKRVIGIDLSERFVRRGLSHPTAYAYDQIMPCRDQDIELRFGSVTGEASANLQADALCCFQSLHHLDLDSFIATCDRITTPGAHIVISDPASDHPLRRVGDTIGRWSGLLSPDERPLSAAQVRQRFEQAGFETILDKALNPTLEIYFHMTELLTPLSTNLSLAAKAPMGLLRPLENFLENVWVARFPRWGWRYMLVFRKPERGER